MPAATSTNGSAVRAADLRVGQRVRVRSREDILQSLDEGARIDGLPFMPEMLKFAGQELTVDAVTHRTCDTVKTTGTSGTTRGMAGAVHLTGARCDGSAHGGCQARCLLYWKEDWLESVKAGNPSADMGEMPSLDDVPALLARATRGEGDTTEDPVYSCQATEVLQATCFVSPRDPRIWVRDVRSGNASM